MSALIKQASEHWRYVAPLLTRPANEDDYDALVEALDELLVIVGDDEDHPLATLASHMGDLIEAYDEAHRPMPKVSGVEMLRYLMQEHGLTQTDLPEVGVQSVVSELLSGKRLLNVRHIRALSERFGVPADVFL
ncbi:HTH-type transcriptional regulator / antitoxin HigA [Azotobacter beijerinckii]|uniref:HTH-type transcriptional regulator / antitoxin HigA n=1 Tax=Azotobacter beijerinckii TaxID=170623 RepID=A0A1H6ZTR9_9GAMM|nr:helix-turn-helix domain-containing protein [Azotobacter beijerinckii]SEJ41953.1 HTH-type transcriptional regulator / antitoxin HigA [Azotobacter beijerinckii]SEJ56849.1 HTH-type transcriptional regulator / antitoxin HigA [Azotobacter beijerinckii]